MNKQIQCQPLYPHSTNKSSTANLHHKPELTTIVGSKTRISTPNFNWPKNKPESTIVTMGHDHCHYHHPLSTAYKVKHHLSSGNISYQKRSRDTPLNRPPHHHHHHEKLVFVSIHNILYPFQFCPFSLLFYPLHLRQNRCTNTAYNGTIIFNI